jgi:hypothetical protein
LPEENVNMPSIQQNIIDEYLDKQENLIDKARKNSLFSNEHLDKIN